MLASVIEAVIGACNLHVGYERTAEAVVEAFSPEIQEALEKPSDFKTQLDVALTQHQVQVRYAVINKEDLPYGSKFVVAASVDGWSLVTAKGRTRKHAEQAAARKLLHLLAKETHAEEPTQTAANDLAT